MLTGTRPDVVRPDEPHPDDPHHDHPHHDAPRVAATRDAWQALVRLHDLRGPVVLVQAGPRGPGDPRLECVAGRDFVVAPADRRAGTVDRCPVYVDADADDGAHRPVYLLDLVAGPASEATLAPDAGHHFVARTLGTVPLTA